MTDDATIIVDTEPSATVAAPPAPAAAPTPTIPGNPAQTQATVNRFKSNPEEADYVFSQIGYGDALKEAKQGRLEIATLKAALQYGIPEDKLSLIADATPEGIMQRAAALAPLLPKPDNAAASAPEPNTGAAAPAKAAGTALPPVNTAVSQRIEPTQAGIHAALVGMLSENPHP